jgi:hypothetical protein
VNALLAAETMIGAGAREVPAIPHERLRALLDGAASVRPAAD